MHPCSARRFVLAFVVIAIASALPLAAQTIADEAAALTRARREAAQAQRRAALLERGASQAADAAARARAEEAAVATRMLAAEADVTGAEARIRIVARLRALQRARLAERQGPIVRLVAGLQTMARRPPALALVQPGSITDVVHVRAVLAGQLPLMRARTASLRREIAQGQRLQAQADRAATLLRNGQRELGRQRVALAALEARHRDRAQGFTDNALMEEDRATALGEEARDIVDLMGRIDAQAEIGRHLAALPGPLPRPPIAGHIVPPERDPAGFDPVRLRYRLPVAGRLVTGLGEVSPAGIRARGLTLMPRPNAQVVAPAAGRIAFAGPFRDYANIVIIDHGDGLASLITHLAALTVKAGDRVAIARPIGRAATAKQAVTVELRRGREAIDIIPLIAAG